MVKRVVAFAAVAAALAVGLFLSQRKESRLQVSGLIEADEIRVGSRVGGRVLRVLVEEGQRVRAGDILVELEPYDLLHQRARAEAELAARQAEAEKIAAGFREEEIAQAKARQDQLAAHLDLLIHGPRKQEIATARALLQLAEAELELAGLEHKRLESLVASSAVAREQLDRASSNLKVAQATVQARREELAQLEEGTRPEELDIAKAQLEEARQASLLQERGYRKEEIAQAQAAVEAARAAKEIVERQIEELAIKAPIDGVIEAVELRAGDLVGANAPAVSLLDTSRLWVRAYVPESRLNIQSGQPVWIRVDSFPQERFAGHVSFISSQAEFTPRNVQTPEERSKQVFRIKALLDEGLERLRPGMSADVSFEEGAKERP